MATIASLSARISLSTGAFMKGADDVARMGDRLANTVAKSADRASNAFSGTGSAVSEQRGKLLAAMRDEQDAIDSAGKTADGFGKSFLSAFLKGLPGAGILSRTLDSIAEKIGYSKAQIAARADAAVKAEERIQKAKEATERAAEALAKIEASAPRTPPIHASAMIRPSRQPADTVTNRHADAGISDVAKSADRVSKAADAIPDPFKGWGPAAQRAGKTVDALADHVNKTAPVLPDPFGGFAGGARTAGASIESIGKQAGRADKAVATMGKQADRTSGALDAMAHAKTFSMPKSAAASVDEIAASADKAGAAVSTMGQLGGIAGAALATGVGAAVAAVAAVGVAVTGAAAVLGKFTKDAFTAIPATSKFADTVGVSTESLVTMELAAKRVGVGTDDFRGALVDLNKMLGAAGSGSLNAADAFNRLGLSGKTLAALPLETALGRIGDSLSKLPAGAQRAAAAYGVFGDNAAKILPLLSQGTEGIAKAAEEAKQMGLQFGALDADKIELANRSFDTIKDTLTGIGRQLAIQIAPAIIAVGAELKTAFANGPNMMDAIANGAEKVVTFFAKLVDMAQQIRGVFKKLGVQAGKAFITILEGMEQLIQAGAKLPRKLGGDMFATAAMNGADNIAKIKKSIDDLAESAEDDFQGDAIHAVESFFARIRDRAADAATDLAKVKDRMTAASFNPDKALFDKAASIIESNRSPLEKFEEQMAQLNAMADKGVLSFEQYARAASKAVDELEKANNMTSTARAPAVQQGTVQAQQAINAFELRSRNEERRENPQERVERAMNDAREIAKRQEALQRQMAEYLRQLADEDSDFDL